MRYTVSNPPQDPKALAQWVLSELNKLAQVNTLPLDSITLDSQHRAPAKVREGIVVFADGSDWNPGSGKGYYGYYGGAWHFLG